MIIYRHGFNFVAMAMYLPFSIQDNQFLITAHRSLFWENEKALILSDLHLGKSGHFRKSGIAIPQTVLMEDMQRLMAQIQFYKPEKLIIVGDLFHSEANKEHALFLKWRADFELLPVHLVLGNHDILQKSWYEEANIILHYGSFSIGEITFIHDIKDCDVHSNNYCISGHIHPAIRLTGSGRQALQLACFYFGKKYAVLPAFGKFTGTFVINPAKDEAVFALVNNAVMRIQ